MLYYIDYGTISILLFRPEMGRASAAQPAAVSIVIGYLHS